MKLRRFIVAAILVVCISFLGYWAFFFIKPAVDGVGKNLLNLFLLGRV